MTAIEINKTCSSKPVQFEIKLADGRMIYFRFRDSYLEIRISDQATDNIYDCIEPDGKMIYEWFDNENLGNGDMENEDCYAHMIKAGIDLKNILQ